MYNGGTKNGGVVGVSMGYHLEDNNELQRSTVQQIEHTYANPIIVNIICVVRSDSQRLRQDAPQYDVDWRVT